MGQEKRRHAMDHRFRGAVDVRASEAHLRKRPPHGPLEELPVFGDDCQHLESESQQSEYDRCHDDILGCLRGLLPAICRFHQRTYQPTRRDHSERLLHAQTLERQAHCLCDDGASLGVALADQATKIVVCPFLPAGLDTSSLRVLQDKGRGSRLPIMLRLPFAP